MEKLQQLRSIISTIDKKKFVYAGIAILLLLFFTIVATLYKKQNTKNITITPSPTLYTYFRNELDSSIVKNGESILMEITYAPSTDGNLQITEIKFINNTTIVPYIKINECANCYVYQLDVDDNNGFYLGETNTVRLIAFEGAYIVFTVFTDADTRTINVDIKNWIIQFSVGGTS